MDFEQKQTRDGTENSSDGERSSALPHEGRDELNLAEFPLSALANRFLDGRKTVVLTDQVWDRDRREYVPRELALSGSDRYGLPCAKDEDVLLACVQLSSQQNFRTREMRFSRYELLQLLRWHDDGRTYRRLTLSLRRWKGLTVYSSRAFYDHAHKSWINRDFGIFDNLYLYEREAAERGAAGARSWLIWNDVLFDSFQSGYLKKLDWNLYCRLSDPVAKRLYRLLDKRFFYGDAVTFDLRELAFRKLRLSPTYNTAQIKRAIGHGIQELEAYWELRSLPPERRFVKRQQSQWDVVFERKKPRRSQPTTVSPQVAAAADLESELARRGVGPATAAELVEAHPVETVRTMVCLFDWYGSHGKPKGAGFLVDSIKNPGKYRLPREFRAAGDRAIHKRVPDSRKGNATGICHPADRERAVQEQARLQAFLAFWSLLVDVERQAFEANALAVANPTKRDGYLRNQADGGSLFEQYRQTVLLDHFERQIVER